VLSPESARYAGLNGFGLMVIPYAVTLEGVKQSVKIYHEALLGAGHNIEDHTVQATFHLYAASTEAEAKAAAREPMERYVQYFADAIAGDRWSKDYVGYQGMAEKVLGLKNFDVLYDGRVMIGDPPRLHAMMERALEAGIGELSFITMLPGLEQAKVLDCLRLFAEEIMPRYR